MLDSNWNKLVVCKFYHTAHRFYARVQSSTCTTYDKYLWENKNDRANCEIGYYKGKLSSFIVKKIFIEFRLKSEFFKGFTNLFVFDFLFTIIKKSYDLLWWRKCSLTLDYVIGWHVLKDMSKSLKYTSCSLMYQF